MTSEKAMFAPIHAIHAPAVRERPILFSAPMVRAILAGQKTQTRRIVKLDPSIAKQGGDLTQAWPDLLWGVTPGLQVPCADETTQRLRNPWGFPEPCRLWVRETHYVDTGHAPDDYPAIHYRADMEERQHDGASISPPWDIRSTHKGPWTPSIFMRRWSSRITLDVTSVRVERLQDIGDEDARAEGVVPLQMDHGAHLPRFEALWGAINGKRAPWTANPWVWVVSFRRVQP